MKALLSSTEYVDNLRSLVKKQTYGNGAYRTYDYDDQDRVTAEYVNGTAIAKYIYDKLGRVYKYTDVAANVTYTYEYDLIGRVLTITASDGRIIGYSYDNFNRVSELKQSVAGVSLNNKYHYNAGDGSIKAVSLNGTTKLSYGFDGFGRQNIRKLYTTAPFITEYTFLEGTDGNTTTLVKTVKNGSETLQYSYDKIGNITSISKNGTVVESYTYDSLNQLATVTRGSDVYEYTYDNGGNILSVKLNGTAVKTYAYTNSDWKDQLTAYNGQTITYDAIGNPLTYRDGYVFTWANGRQLSTVTNGTDSYSYTYNADGLRTSKTVNGTTTEYYWMGSVLQGQKTGDEYILYLHDENGNTYGFLLKNGTTEAYYYYIFNAQGDVIGILDSTGTNVVEYTYSAWGEVLSVTGTLASTIGQTNPIRYRGYYYDNETGFYYCNSRYYDPETCRWINADIITGAIGYVNGNNVYVYCFNCPILLQDKIGAWPSFGDIWDAVTDTFEEVVDWVDENVLEPVGEFVGDVIEDVVNYDRYNESEEKVLQSNYFSSYKGVPVFRINGNRSGSFGAIFLTRETNNRQHPEDVLRHEYGHTKQLEQLGVIYYAFFIALPSWQEWGEGDYYSKPWEITADIYGGVQSRSHSQTDIAAGFAYLEGIKMLKKVAKMIGVVPFTYE